MCSPSAAPRWMMNTKRRDRYSLGRTPSSASRASRARGAPPGGKKEPACEHVHLLTNSGLTSSKASPSAGLSARAMAVRVGSLSAPGSTFSASARGSSTAAALAGDPLRSLDPAHQRFGRGPARGDIVVAGGRTRLPRRLAELVQQRRRPSAARELFAIERAQRRHRPFPRVLELERLRRPRLGRFDDRAIERRQVAAAARDRPRLSRSTIAGGGSSPAKWRASLVARCFAVAGLAARSIRTARACASPSWPSCRPMIVRGRPARGSARRTGTRRAGAFAEHPRCTVRGRARSPSSRSAPGRIR